MYFSDQQSALSHSHKNKDFIQDSGAICIFLPLDSTSTQVPEQHG